MANRTTHRRMLAAPEPEPKASMDLSTLKKQAKPSTSRHLSINLDPPMAIKPSHRQRSNSQQFMSASAIMDYSSNSRSYLKPNPQPKSVSAVPNIQKQSKPTKELAWKDKPHKLTNDMDKKKVEEVLVKKKKKEEDEFDGRRLSVSMAATSNGGRRSSLSGSQVQLADVFASNGVKMVSADMPPFMQIHAVECARKTHDSLEKFTSKTLALTLKKEFDGVYGPAWHCIVGTSFGSFVTHSVSGFLYFSMDQKLHILLFKTTVQRAD